MAAFSKKKQGVLILCFFCLSSLLGQNLIKNPSFEAHADCPKTLGNFHKDVDYWSTPTSGSTDYFHGCSTAMGTPKNFNGTQPADFGEGYAGLYFYAPQDYREYLQAELTSPLVKDTKYRVSFYVSLAERSDFAVKDFGILFSKEKIEIPIKKELSKRQLYRETDNKYTFLEVGYSNFYADTQDWIQVNTQFTAKGTERFMTLGNFKPNARTRLFKTKRNARQGAYYYVDMVLVEALEKVNKDSSVVRTGVADKSTFTLDTPHVLKNLLFEFDRFNVDALARKEMSTLYTYLNTDEGLQITLNGHTDNIGSDAYNMWLSKKRAEAVAHHLIRLGLPKSRIDWEGHGGSQPVATNANEEGRRKNRRVEFTIFKKPPE